MPSKTARDYAKWAKRHLAPSPLENRQRRSGQPAVWRGARWPSLFSRAQSLRPFRGVPEAYKISDTTASQLAKVNVLDLRRAIALLY